MVTLDGQSHYDGEQSCWGEKIPLGKLFRSLYKNTFKISYVLWSDRCHHLHMVNM